MEEKRRSIRMDIDVQIQLKAVNSDETMGKIYNVDVINISRGGMAFRCKDELCVDGFYDTQITIWTKETIHALIRIVRKADNGEYGCKFASILPTDLFKIEVYELFNYYDGMHEEESREGST